MIVTATYDFSSKFIDNKYLEIVIGDNMYNLKELDNGILEILKVKGTKVKGTALQIVPVASNVIRI